jgi:hypothetical protein
LTIHVLLQGQFPVRSAPENSANSRDLPRLGLTLGIFLFNGDNAVPPMAARRTGALSLI